MTGFVGFAKSYFPDLHARRHFRQDHGEQRRRAGHRALLIKVIGKDRAVLAVIIACGVLAYGA